MSRLPLFRDRLTAASAIATASFLAWTEASDVAQTTEVTDEERDEGTIGLVSAAVGVAVAMSVLASARRRRPFPARPAKWWIGLGLIWSGGLWNRWAKHTLGRAYRPRVTIVEDHEIVADGPYEFVRHPMYAGGVLICAGTALVVDRATATVAWALPVLALLRRIQVEERVLGEALGAEYESFAAGRARLVPGIW